MAVTLREGTEEALKAMERFELRSLIELTRGMELEETVRRKIIEDVVKADKRLRLVYQMIEQEEQQKKEQALRKKRENTKGRECEKQIRERTERKKSRGQENG